MRVVDSTGRRRRSLQMSSKLALILAGVALLAVPGSAPGYPFADATSIPSGTNPHGVLLVDLDRDLRLDLVAANSGSSNVFVRRGAGDGTFGAAQSFAVGGGPKSVTAVDLTGDGVLDLATANQDASTVSVLIGNGNGGFGAAAHYGACGRPHEIAAADFNGDGRPDLAVPCWGGSVVSVLLANGPGTFAPAVNYGTELDPHSVAIGDYNGDGRRDLALANHGSASVSVLLGNANGTFQADVVYPVGTNPHSIRAADFNGDSRLDLATANDGSDNISVLRGNGNGTFGAATNFATGKVPKAVLAADVSGDGKLDLVTANTAGNYPSGTLNPGGNEISVLLGDGAGAFGSPRAFTVGHTPFAVAAGDVDGNGQLDLATANFFSGDLSLLLNPAPAALPPGFTESIVLSGLTQPTAVRFASDGRVFVAEKAGIVKVFDSLTDATPSTFADLNVKVHNFWDRGLLGLALHPNFPATPHTSTCPTPTTRQSVARRHGGEAQACSPTRVPHRPVRPPRAASSAAACPDSPPPATRCPARSRCSSRDGASSSRATRSARWRSDRTGLCMRRAVKARTSTSRTTARAGTHAVTHRAQPAPI